MTFTNRGRQVKDILVTDLMSRDVGLVAPETPLREVIAHMQADRHSCTIIGALGIPSGIITERDLVALLDRIIDQPALAEQPARTLMSTPPVTVLQDRSLFDALVISRAEQVRHLPVVDAAQRLVGLLTQTDLAHAHFRVIERQRILIEEAIENRTERLRSANRELQALALEDGLLGVGNRRAMGVDMEHTHSLALRYERPYSVALLDVDYFKAYNDHYGHPAGDRALQQLSRRIEAAMRKSDRLYRYGGEELLVLMPDTPLREARTLAGRIIEHLQRTAIPHDKSPYGVVTLSAGLAGFAAGSGEATPDWEEIVEQADRALYRAKHLGRNRVA